MKNISSKSMLAKSDVGYVTDARDVRHTPEGKRLVSGGWRVMWREVRDGQPSYVEGATYTVKRAAEAALTQAWKDKGGASEAAAAMGRLGRGASKRRDPEHYRAIGKLGGLAGKGGKKPRGGK